MVFTISECFDGHYEIQTPNEWGGLYPLTPRFETVRDMPRAYQIIGEYVVEHSGYNETIEIRYLYYGHEENGFNRDN